MDNPDNRFYAECRAWDGAHIDQEALDINGFTEEQARDVSKKSEEEVVREYLEWLGDIRDWTNVGQNPSFDRDFLRFACERYHINFPLPYRTVDVHTLTYMHICRNGGTPPFDAARHHGTMNLDYALSYCGIPEEPKPHNALTGAMCHAETASRLLYNKQLLEEFKIYPIPFSA